MNWQWVHYCSTGLIIWPWILTVYTPSRQLHSSADTHILHIPHFRTINSLDFANAVFPTVLQSNGICSLLKFVTLNPLSLIPSKNVLKSHLYKQYHKLFQILSSYLPPQFPLPTFLMCMCMFVCVCVCVYVCVCVCVRNTTLYDYII